MIESPEIRASFAAVFRIVHNLQSWGWSYPRGKVLGIHVEVLESVVVQTIDRVP